MDKSTIDDLTVLIPAWNERECIVAVLDEFGATPSLAGVKLLVVDDGSTDGTGPLLDEYARSHPRMKALHVPHGGKDRALWAGFMAVDTEWTGMMDGDGQYDPKDFPELLHEASIRKADAVWGIRSQRHDNILRFISSSIGRITKRLMLGSRTVRDTGCGIWIARSKYLRPIPGTCADPAGQVHCHIPELITVQGGVVEETDIVHRSRHAGQAKFGALNRVVPGLKSLSQAAAARRQLRNTSAGA